MNKASKCLVISMRYPLWYMGHSDTCSLVLTKFSVRSFTWSFIWNCHNKQKHDSCCSRRWSNGVESNAVNKKS
jgi:hypothetical protein